jgi:hypothetical protein
MLVRILTLMIFITIIIACRSPQIVQPQEAQQALGRIWQADAHIVWELDWPAAPVAGPLIVETWRAGPAHRLEILEAVAPAVRGETLVFDGQTAWRYNRFQPPTNIQPASPSLSPVTDALMLIDRLLQAPPEQAVQDIVYLNGVLTQKTELIFANADRLTLWSDRQLGLPVQLEFSIQGQQATLRARQIEPLSRPPAGLFEVGDWINNLR